MLYGKNGKKGIFLSYYNTCFFLLKGALHVLLNQRVLYLMTHYWEVIEKVWLAIAQVTRGLHIKKTFKQIYMQYLCRHSKD